MSVFPRVRLVGLALIGGVALAVTPALTASAHVSVSSSDAAPGGTGTLVFRVPTESDTAGTVGLSVELPTDTPFRSVRAGYLPGWTVTIERSALTEPVEVGGFTLTEAVSRVTWTADAATTAAGGIGPDQYGMFDLRVGPFPEEGGTYAFPATQTYSDGEVVVWGEVAEAGAGEPDHPAPTITVSGEPVGDDHGHGAADTTPATSGDTTDDADTSDTTARALGVVGIAVGAAGLAGGALTGRRRGKLEA